MTECFSTKMVELLSRHALLIPLRPKPDLIATELWYTAEIDKVSVDAQLAKRA